MMIDTTRSAAAGGASGPGPATVKALSAEWPAQAVRR